MTARPTPEGLLNSRQAAALIHVSERTLRDLRNRGLIAYVAITDRLVMYRPEDCAEYIASRLRRNDPCEKPGTKPPKQPRRTRHVKRGGVVLPFERLAEQKGW